MIIDNPIVSGSLNVQNNVTASNGLFTSNLTVEGTIYGAISGSSATASYVEYENVANKPTLVSSSAQLADDISGSFTSLSSSIASDRLKNTTDTLTGDLTVTGTLTAQDLVVQEITSSIIYSSGSNKFGNELSNSHNFTGSVNITGSLNVNGAEVGTGKLDETVFNAYTSSTDTRLDNLEATGSDQESRIDTLEGKTLISSSAQIGTEISGAFTDVSSSFSTRVTNLEDFSSSLDATFATDADLNLVSASVDNILAATSSYALSASISGAFTSVSSSIAADIEDIIDGTTTVASASHAVSSLTASYALNAGAGAGFPFSGSAIITGSLEVSGSTISGSFIGDGSGLTGITVSSTNTVTSSFSSTGSVTILHSFNSKNVSVSVYDDNDILIIPQQVTLLDNNNVKIDFGGNTTGFAVLAKGGHLVSGSVPVPQLSTVTDSFSSTTSHTVTHNFGTKEVIVSVYENDELIIPDSITTPTTDTVTVSFPEAISGRVVVVKAGHIVSGSIPFSNLLDSPLISGSGAITASGHLVPSENETYDLGSSTKRWRDIYLSGSSIYLGNTVITEGNIVTTGSLSGSLPAGVISGSAQIATEISGAFTSVSSSFASGRLKNTTDTLTGDLTVTGTLTAQDLHVQEVTSSIIYSSGSNIFGNSTSDTQVLYGNVGVGTNTNLSGKLNFPQSDYGEAINFYTYPDATIRSGIGKYTGEVRHYIPTNDFITFYSGGPSGTELMRISGSGYVGIGTSSPKEQLEIAQGATSKFYGFNAVNDLTPANTVYISAPRNGNFGIFTDSTERLTVNISGSVGVGTTTVSYPLHVSGSNNTMIGVLSDYTITNFQDIVTLENRTMTANKNLSFNIGKTGSTNNLGKLVYKHVSDGSTDNLLGLGFFDNDFILNVVATGRVGIGTTSPTAGLTVRGTSGGAAVDFTNSTASTGRTYRWVSLNAGGFAVEDITDGGTKRLVIDSAGKVGIGTDTPVANLEIFGTGNTLRLDSAANQSKTILLRNVGTGTAELKTDGDLKLLAEDAGKNIYFDTSGGTKMIILSNGNVGISSNTPTEKLDVAGNIKGQTARFTSNFGHSFGDTAQGGGRGLSILNSTLSNQTYYLTLGKAESSYNQGEISFSHVSDGSASNSLRLGLYGNPDNVIIYANGIVYFPNGSVGIGTTSTSYQLQVNGTGYINETLYVNGDTTIDANLDLTSGGRVKVSGGNTDQYYFEGARNGVGVTYRLYDNANNIYHDSYTSQVIRVNQIGGSSGEFIVSGGDTSFNSNNVKINGGTSYNDKSNLYLSNNRTLIQSDIVNLTANGDTSLDFQTRSGGSTASAMFIDEFRRVGIGTNAPDEKLHVNGNIAAINSSYPTIKVQGSDVNYQARMRWDTNNNLLEFLTRHAGTYYGDTLVLKQGKVGIGTNNPAAKLDVYGDIYVNGTQSYPVVAVDRRHITNGSTTITTGASYADIGPSVSYTPKQTGNIIMVYHGCQTWYGSTSNGTGDISVRFLVDGVEVWENNRATGNMDADSTRQHLYLNSIFTFTASSTSAHTIKFQAYPSGTVVSGFNLYHTNDDANQFIFVEYQV